MALGYDVVLHAPDAKGDGFFRAPRSGARAFPVAPAEADMHAMIEQRVADYIAHSRNPGTATSISITHTTASPAMRSRR